MRWFRRDDETLNEKLLREAGLAERQKAVHIEAAPLDQPGSVEPRAQPLLTGLWQERTVAWDAVVSAWVPDLHGDRFEFVAETDGSLIVDESVADSLSELADAFEKELRPPYRALAVRQGKNVWSVAGQRITLVRLRLEEGGAIELSRRGGDVTYRLDGKDADPSTAPRELIGIGENKGSDFAIRAQRLDGDLWEATAETL